MYFDIVFNSFNLKNKKVEGYMLDCDSYFLLCVFKGVELFGGGKVLFDFV